MILRWRGARRAAVLRGGGRSARARAGGRVGTARPARGRVLRHLAVDVSAGVRVRVSTPRPGYCPPSAARWDHDVVGAIVFAGEARVAAPHRRPTARRSPQPPSPGSIATRRSLGNDHLASPLCPTDSAGAAADQRRPGDAGQRARRRPSATPMPVFRHARCDGAPVAVIRRVLAPSTVADRVPVPLEAVVSRPRRRAALVMAADDGARCRFRRRCFGPDRHGAALPRARPGRHGLDARCAPQLDHCCPARSTSRSTSSPRRTCRRRDALQLPSSARRSRSAACRSTW
jgi:hypothetical protein